MLVSEEKCARENVIPKINLTNDLEKMYPYPNYLAWGDYWSRIERARKYIPEQFHFYALALFANVVYIPSIVLDEAWRYHLRELNKLHGLNGTNLLSNALLLGEDVDLARRFVYANNMKGRLDLNKQPRSQRIGDLAETLLLCACSNDLPEIKSSLDTQIRQFVERRYWILLIDYSLSGYSLHSELEKLFDLLEIANPAAKVIVLVQIITSDALGTISEIASKRNAEIIESMYFDEKFKINSEYCALFNDLETLKGVRELCRWFADEILNKDEEYNETRDLSGDDLRFGFKASGMTLVTPNCPSNSIPLLWYYKPRVYEGPYPRVESRTTQVKSLDKLILETLKRKKGWKKPD